MSLADTINSTASAVIALQAAVAALQPTTPVDLTATNAAIAAVKSDTDAILADLTPAAPTV